MRAFMVAVTTHLWTRLAKVRLVWQFAIAFFVVALLPAGFSFSAVSHYADRAVETSSFSLMSRARSEVFARIDSYLSTPERIVMRNAALARNGSVPLHDETRLSRFFLDQISEEHLVDYLYFANEEGGIADAGFQDRKLLLLFSPGMKNGDMMVDRVDTSGNFLGHEKVVRGFDPRTRGWYKSVKDKRRLFWTQPYAGAVSAPLAITAACPLIGPDGELQGVFGADVLLDVLGGFLETIRVSPNSYAIVVEADGSLVADSSKAPLFVERNGEVVRLKAASMPQALAGEAAGIVERMSKSGAAEPLSTLLHDARGGAYYVDVSRYFRGDDIRWYLIMLVPRSDFSRPLDALWMRFLVICLCGLGSVLALSRVLAFWVTRPMRLINERVKALAYGAFGNRVETRREDEIGELAHSFNDMSVRLAHDHEEIGKKNAALDAANRDLTALLERERVRRTDAEAAGRRAVLLGEATAILSETPDYEGVFAALTRLVVRSFADWAVFDIGVSGKTARVAGAHRDPEMEPLLRELSEKYPAGIATSTPAATMLRTGVPLHLPAMTDEQIRSFCVDDHHAEIVRRLGTRSAVVVPLVAREARIGALTLVASAPYRFEPADLELVAELGRRAALAVDNARLLGERKRSEEALRRTEEQLRQAQKMEAIGTLAGGIAHDFNNLLSVILSYSEMLLGDMSPNDPHRNDVEQVQIAGKRAAELTRQLLAFGRKQVLQPQIVSLNEILKATERMLRRVIGEDIGLTVVCDPALGTAKVDPGQIDQILMNLAVNSRDAMPQGGRLTLMTANVDLDEAYAAEHAGVVAGPHVMLAVTDTGLGMDEATQARMFEPFFTTKEMGRGTGLGLSTVFGIVQQSGGSICVHSDPGQGTTFKIYFPRTDAATAEARAPASTRSGALTGTETILLVEDDDRVRVLAHTILQKLGYRVIEAQSGGDGLVVCETHRGVIHLLLTDVIMPHMSGRQLSERVRRLRPEMRVLFMSGYTDNALVQHGVLDSSVALLEKPFTPETLAQKVRDVLDTDSPRPGRGT